MPRLPLIATLLICAASAANARENEPVGEDPLARYRERVRQFGQRTPEESARMLRAARAEAVKYGLGGSLRAEDRFSASTALRVQGSTFTNLGPTKAAFEKNGIKYTNVDSGRVRKILVHPTDPNIVYVATAGGGVWKTFNATATIDFSNGPTWRPITDALGALSVGSMAMDPNNPNILVLGLGDPFDNPIPGLVTTSDGGMTWSPEVELTGFIGGSEWTATSVRDIQFDGSGTGIVHAATDIGVFRNTQGGTSGAWTLVNLTGSAESCWSAAWIGGQTWVASCDTLLFRSTDGGASWTNVTSGLPASANGLVGRMTVASARGDAGNPNTARVYVLAGTPSGMATKDVYKSTDGGRTYRALGVNADGTPTNWNNDQPDLDVLHQQAWYNQMIEVDPRNGNHVVVGGNLAMVRSRDGGSTWDVMCDWLPLSPLVSSYKLPYVHADWHTATFSYAGDKFVFYGGTDGGIFRSFDLNTAAAGKATFEDRMNRGIVTHLIYFMVADETDANNQLVLGGFQDNGTRLRSAPNNPSDTSSGPTTFDQIWGGDGIGVAMGRAGPTSAPSAWGTLLVVTNPDSLQRSSNGGLDFSPMMNGLPVNAYGEVPGNFYMKVVTDFADPKGRTFLTLVNQPGGSRIYKWVENGSATNSWGDITGTVQLRSGGTAAMFGSLSMLAADPKHAGQYGAVGGSRAYRKPAGSTTWYESAPAPKGALASISFDPADTNTFWVGSRSGSSGAHVFRTTDGGATWEARAGSGATELPDVGVFVVKVDPNDAQTIYAGTEVGLYRSTDAGLSWYRFGKGLPLVAITDISVTMDSAAMRVSTYGRGFWEMYPSFGAPNGVYGDGDFDSNGMLDGFDLISLGTVMGLTTVDAAYTAKGNLVGTTNSIDNDDLVALIARIGGRP